MPILIDIREAILNFFFDYCNARHPTKNKNKIMWYLSHNNYNHDHNDNQLYRDYYDVEEKII